MRPSGALYYASNCRNILNHPFFDNQFTDTYVDLFNISIENILAYLHVTFLRRQSILCPLDVDHVSFSVQNTVTSYLLIHARKNILQYKRRKGGGVRDYVESVFGRWG